ncbi:MAG: hypothetical protein ACI4UL_04505 [Muribaculaceae bacterium]
MNNLILKVLHEEPLNELSLKEIRGGGCGLYRYRNIYDGGEFEICSPYKDKNTLIDSLFQ